MRKSVTSTPEERVGLLHSLLNPPSHSSTPVWNTQILTCVCVENAFDIAKREEMVHLPRTALRLCLSRGKLWPRVHVSGLIASFGVATCPPYLPRLSFSSCIRLVLLLFHNGVVFQRSVSLALYFLQLFPWCKFKRETFSTCLNAFCGWTSKSILVSVADIGTVLNMLKAGCTVFIWLFHLKRLNFALLV